MKMDFVGFGYQITLVLLFLAGNILAVENEWSIPVEHSWTGVDGFISRGIIRVTLSSRPDSPPLARFLSSAKLNDAQKGQIISAARSGQIYRIRAPTQLRDEESPIKDDRFVISFTDSCRLVRSRFHEVITVSIDSSQSRLISLTTQSVLLKSDKFNCDQDTILDESLLPDSFNTTIRVVDLIDGPSPETQAYIEKLDKEKEERQRGQQQDNRSFLAKYWMYIVPVVIFVMLSNAMNSEPEGGR